MLYKIKYIYFNGAQKHLGIALVFGKDVDECKEKISQKIQETYKGGSILKFNSNIEEFTEDVLIIQ